MPQLPSRIAYKRFISPAKGVKRLLDPGRKRAKGIKAKIEGLLVQVKVIKVISNLFVVIA